MSKEKNLIWEEQYTGVKYLSDPLPYGFSEKIRNILDKYGRIERNEMSPIAVFSNHISKKNLFAVYVTGTSRNSQKNFNYVCCVTDTFEEALTRFNKEKERLNDAFANALVQPLSNVVEVCGARVLVLSHQDGFFTITLNRIPATEVPYDFSDYTEDEYRRPYYNEETVHVADTSSDLSYV